MKRRIRTYFHADVRKEFEFDETVLLMTKKKKKSGRRT